MKTILTIKDYLYLSVIILLVVVSGTAFFAYRAGAQDRQAEVQTTESKQQLDNESKIYDLLFSSEGGNLQYNIPHLNCQSQYLYNTTPSDTYVANLPYNLSFYRGSPFSGFQDLNGDGLADFLSISYNYASNGSTLSAQYVACVYLHNGSGWEKAYICDAKTESDANGNVILRQYYGDCAGAPNSKE